MMRIEGSLNGSNNSGVVYGDSPWIVYEEFSCTTGRIGTRSGEKRRELAKLEVGIVLYEKSVRLRRANLEVPQDDGDTPMNDASHMRPTLDCAAIARRTRDTMYVDQWDNVFLFCRVLREISSEGESKEKGSR